MAESWLRYDRMVELALRGVVRKALSDVGYTGYVTTELPAGDVAYLRDVAERVDKLVLGI